MSDTVKLIIEIPKETKQAFDKAESNDLKGGYYDHGGIIGKAIQNGIPLDDVTTEINEKMADYVASGYADSVEDFEEYSRIVNQALDNIGKESEVKPNEQCRYSN